MKEILLNQNFLHVLSELFPKKNLLVKEIANTLDLDNISIYRRLNGFTSFRADEIATLARKYHISLDKILDMQSVNHINMELDMCDSIEEIDYEVIEKRLNFLEQLISQPYSEMGGVFHAYPVILFTPYKYLLKYHWFLWNHYYHEKNRTQHYEALEIPQKLMEYNYIGYEMYKHITYRYHIWNTSLMSRLISDLKYFKDIQLISPDSIRLIKNELQQGMEAMDERGAEIYLCDLNINNTEVYMWSEEMALYTAPAFSIQRINSTNKAACNIARHWIQRIRAASILISESGEKEKMQFLKKQKEEIEQL